MDEKTEVLKNRGDLPEVTRPLGDKLRFPDCLFMPLSELFSCPLCLRMTDTVLVTQDSYQSAQGKKSGPQCIQSLERQLLHSLRHSLPSSGHAPLGA